MKRERSIKALPRKQKLALIREAQDVLKIYQSNGENDVET